MLYLITYDLKGGNKDYNSLYDSIKNLGDYNHPLESTWFVKSNLKADKISELLRLSMDSNDLLYIVEVTSQKNRQGWLPKTTWTWFDSL